MKKIYVITKYMMLWITVFMITSLANASSDKCKQGYVWREAFPGDKVCVTPKTRSQAAADNRAAKSRYQPGGGKYGRDTCKKGYVWREARKRDHVCVTPQVRKQTAMDNRMAKSRLAGGASHQQVPARQPQGVRRPDAHSYLVPCPVRQVRAEITTRLPGDWWQTPQEGALKRTIVERIGGKPTLVCRYKAYGGTVSVMRNLPRDSSRCEPAMEGFVCWQDSR